jgi:ABC-type Na+ efflux pump permease subunit
VAAHDRALYRARAIIAFLALIGTGWIADSVFHLTRQASSAAGLQIFYFQSWAAFFCATGAFTATGDSISREKRDGTLGLLFLTHLKGRDVVLGKLASGVSLYITGALATLPILTLPILLGGVRLTQSFYLLVALLNTMLLSSAAGLFASSMSVHKQKAGATAVLIMIFFCLVIPLTTLGLRKIGAVEIAFMLDFLTPLFTHQLASGALLGPQLGFFWTSIALLFSITCALLAAASYITPRSWQQRAKEPLLSRLTQRYAAWSLRTIRSRSAIGRSLLDRNAYEWLAARQLSASRRTWTYILAWVLVGAALIANFIRHNDPAAVLITVCTPIVYILQINAKVRIGGHAADRFSSERESGALELLLCTPLSVRDMVAGEFRALRRLYFLPTLAAGALLFIGLTLSMGGVDRAGQLFTTDGDPIFRRGAYLVIACAAYFLVLDSITLAWAGAWCGLTCKIQYARSNTMFVVIAAPFLFILGIMPFILQSAAVRAYFHETNFFLPLLLASAFITLWNLAIIHLARRWLFGNPRARLTEPAIYSRAAQPFLAFFRIKADSKPPLNIGNPPKAAEF